MSAPPNILLVDDDRSVIASLSQILADCGKLRFALSGADALRLALQVVPDLILLDVELPGMSGFEVCAALKGHAELADVPIIFVTSHDSAEQEVNGLSLGAVDFIGKPPRPAVVQARVRTHLRLKQLTDALRNEATTDALTGIANRRRFDQVLASEWLRAQRAGSPIALLLIDVDFFKLYNDHYGHPAGDRCLQSIAQGMRDAMRRPADLLARYGGEEFAIVLPDTDGKGARAFGGLLTQRVESLGLLHEASKVAKHVTLSIGVSAYDRGCARWVGAPTDLRFHSERPRPPLEALIAAADQALYTAKREGRRRVAFARVGERGSEDDAHGLTLIDAPHVGRAGPRPERGHD